MRLTCFGTKHARVGVLVWLHVGVMLCTRIRKLSTKILTSPSRLPDDYSARWSNIRPKQVSHHIAKVGNTWLAVTMIKGGRLRGGALKQNVACCITFHSKLQFRGTTGSPGDGVKHGASDKHFRCSAQSLACLLFVLLCWGAIVQPDFVNSYQKKNSKHEIKPVFNNRGNYINLMKSLLVIPSM